MGMGWDEDEMEMKLVVVVVVVVVVCGLWSGSLAVGRWSGGQGRRQLIGEEEEEDGGWGELVR